MKCCDLKAGMLREVVDLQSQQNVDIGGGASEVQYVNYDTDVRAFLKPLSGNERLYAERQDAQTRNRMVIRYRSDITESDRVIHRGRAYNIRFINNIEFQDRWLEIDLDGGVST